MDIGYGQGLEKLLRDSLRCAIRSSSMKRPEICSELSIRVGRKISTNMLDNWTSQSKEAWRIPADCIPALCEILRDDTLQRHLLSEPLKEALELGEWAIHSRWILDQVKVELGKHLAKDLSKKQIFKRLRSAR